MIYVRAVFVLMSLKSYSSVEELMYGRKNKGHTHTHTHTHTHIFSLLARRTDRQTVVRRTMAFPLGCVIGFTALSPHQRSLDVNVTFVEQLISIGL